MELNFIYSFFHLFIYLFIYLYLARYLSSFYCKSLAQFYTIIFLVLNNFNAQVIIYLCDLRNISGIIIIIIVIIIIIIIIIIQ